MPTRRRLLLSGILAAPVLPAFPAGKRLPRLLVHGGWRSDSVTDMAQLSGLLALLERELPRVRLTAWVRPFQEASQQWLEATFPRVAFVRGTTGSDGSPDDGALAEAWKKADFLLHGTGGGMLAPEHLRGWQKHAGKPFGLYGVTLAALDARLVELLSGAQFLFLRDGISRAEVIRAGVRSPMIEFAPDATLEAPLVATDKPAEAWLTEQGLEKARFLCVVPKLRHQPYWEEYARPPHDSEKQKVEENLKFQESDQRLLREMIVRLFETGDNDLRVLVLGMSAAEMTMCRAHLVDAMPAKFRHRMQLREPGALPDVAATLLARAAVTISCDLGASLLSLAAGTPAIHLRLPTEDSKGQLWRDIGLQDWMVELEKTTPESIAEMVLALLADPSAARELLEGCREFARQSGKGAMGKIGAVIL